MGQPSIFPICYNNTSMTGLEARPSFLGDTFPAVRKFLWPYGYRFLPLRKDLIIPKNPKRGHSTANCQVKFVRNLNPSDNFPRFGLTITSTNGFQQMEVNLHKDAQKHRVDKKADWEVAKEGQRILTQLSTFNTLPPELTVFKKTLLEFLLFSAGESMQRQRLIEGKSYFRHLLNQGHRQHRQRREGWERRKRREKTLAEDQEVQAY